MITTWKVKKMDARMALIKWMTFKIVLIFIILGFSPWQGLLSKMFSLSSSFFETSEKVQKSLITPMMKRLHRALSSHRVPIFIDVAGQIQ
jgi:hypothetical protein